LHFFADTNPRPFSFDFQKLALGFTTGRITFISRSGANAGSKFGGAFKAKQGGVWHRSHSCMVKGSRQCFSMPQMATVACLKYVATTGYNADPAKRVDFPPYPRI
jgi:hypothetical protein